MRSTVQSHLSWVHGWISILRISGALPTMDACRASYPTWNSTSLDRTWRDEPITCWNTSSNGNSQRLSLKVQFL